jgi:hypothetical protein
MSERVASAEVHRRELVTLDDFNGTNLEAPLEGDGRVSTQHLSHVYFMASTKAEKSGAQEVARVYHLLAQLCRIHLRPEDRASPWSASMAMGEWRSPIPADFKGDQNTVLCAIIPNIENPGLRARIADVVWTNERQLVEMANTAVDAYHLCAKGLLEGRLKPYPDSDIVGFEALSYLQRGLRISYQTRKKDARGRAALHDGLVSLLHQLYELAKQQSAHILFLRTAELALDYRLLESAVVAPDSELVAATGSQDVPLAAKTVWDLGARLYEEMKNNEGLHRCKVASVGQTLAMRKQVAGSAGAEAHWIQEALLELRHVDGLEDLERELTIDLRRLQKEILKGIGRFQFPLDLTEVRNSVTERFSEMSFPDALREFGLLSISPSLQVLKEEALGKLRSSPIQGMWGTGHLDREGKLIAKSAAPDNADEQDDGWLRSQLLSGEDLRWQLKISGYIAPARMIIHDRFHIEERHISPIVEHSPFVPRFQKPIVTLGLTRYMQGDLMSATHLLISQIEPCLRHLLKVAGHDPVGRKDNGTEEDFDLNQMFSRRRPQLENIFGEDWLFELDLLFGQRPGLSLRNDLCHGQISASACFQPAVQYGCWMMYRLCMIFLLSKWERIAADIEAVG